MACPEGPSDGATGAWARVTVAGLLLETGGASARGGGGLHADSLVGAGCVRTLRGGVGQGAATDPPGLTCSFVPAG